MQLRVSNIEGNKKKLCDGVNLNCTIIWGGGGGEDKEKIKCQ